jgi:hypothetical protein
VLLIARHCSVGIILAFEQFRADSGVLKPGTSAEKRVTAPQPFPSPWNHLESGILFGLRLPILVFREADITGGVFDNGVSDVFVHPIPSPDITGPAKSALKQVFQRWAGKVREHYYDDKRA